MQVEVDVGMRVAEAVDESSDPGRGGHAGGVTEAGFVRAVTDCSGYHVYGALHRDVAFVGAAPGGGDNDLDRGVVLVGQVDDLGDLVQRLLGGAVHVLHVVR